MSDDGPYDFRFEEMLAAEGVDLVLVDGRYRKVRRGVPPADPRDDEPTRGELAAEADAERYGRRSG